MSAGPKGPPSFDSASMNVSLPLLLRLTPDGRNTPDGGGLPVKTGVTLLPVYGSREDCVLGFDGRGPHIRLVNCPEPRRVRVQIRHPVLVQPSRQEIRPTTPHARLPLQSAVARPSRAPALWTASTIFSTDELQRYEHLHRCRRALPARARDILAPSSCPQERRAPPLDGGR